ncbi:unnamed protein product [Ectocarpus sp. 13 AM-2016]
MRTETSSRSKDQSPFWTSNARVSSMEACKVRSARSKAGARPWRTWPWCSSASLQERSRMLNFQLETSNRRGRLILLHPAWLRGTSATCDVLSARRYEVIPFQAYGHSRPSGLLFSQLWPTRGR